MKTTHWTKSTLNLVFLIYCLCLAVFSFSHEYWRDELQAYLLVKSSGSFKDLFFNSRYEGHPSLWFIILYLLKAFSSGLLMMKIFHLFISFVVAWLVLKWSPFNLRQKLFLLFGYFLFYEYGFIVRNYALGILFVFCFCAVFPKRKESKYFTILSLLIFGMMITNFYSFFIGCGFAVLLLGEQISHRDFSIDLRRSVPAYFIIFAGILIFLVDTLPPDDYGYASSWTTEFETSELIGLSARFAQVFFPIPPFNLHFWNYTLINNPYILAVLGIIIFVAIVFFITRNNLSRLFVAIVFVLMLLFSYLKFNGYLRHNGHIFITLVAMMWIQPFLPGKKEGMEKTSMLLFESLLLIQLMAMPVAVICELQYPFSQSKLAAAYLEKNHPDELIVAHEDAGCSPVSAFLSHPLFYPLSGSFGTYMIWDKKRLDKIISLTDLVRIGDSLSVKKQKPVIFLLNTPLNENKELILVKSFGPAIEASEEYYLYKRNK